MLVRGFVTAGALGVLLSGCSTVPDGIYFPLHTDPATARMAHTLHRAAAAAGDDPSRYSFGFVRSPIAAAYSDEDATLYVTDGLMRLPAPVIDAVVAHEVAHEALDHRGSRRTLSLSMSTGFSALGIAVPGAGLIDVLVNPIVVRAYSRRQELEADRKAVEILRAMGYAAPRRALAEALLAVDKAGGAPADDATWLLRTHPSLQERFSALEPLDPPVARSASGTPSEEAVRAPSGSPR